MPAQGQQVEATGAVGTCDNVCVLTTVYSSMGGSGDPRRNMCHYLSPLPVLLCLLCWTLHPITMQCCCEGWAGTLWSHSSHVCVTNIPRPGAASHPTMFQNLHGMRQLNKLLPFSQVCRDAHKGATKEIQDKNGRNQSAGSSRELCFPTALVASAEHGRC